MSEIKPIIKWVGGKTQILNQIISSFPKKIHNYYEPFIGGGSVLLGVLSSDIKITGKCYISDLNPSLICLYRMIQVQVLDLIKELRLLSETYNKITGFNGNKKPKNLEDALTSKESYYFYIRKCYNDREEYDVKKAAMLIFLNKTGFRGLYRVGPNGYNVPFGNYTNPTIYDENLLLEVSKLVQDVEFSVSDFTSVIDKVQKDDFIYLDPPYVPEKATSFVGYIEKDFAHTLFFERCHELRGKGISFVMSNACVPLIRQTFPVLMYEIKEIDVRRNINSKKPNSFTKEVIISPKL